MMIQENGLAISTRVMFVYAGMLLIVSGLFCHAKAAVEPAGRSRMPDIHISRAIPVVGQSVLIKSNSSSTSFGQSLVVHSPLGKEISLPLDQAGQASWVPDRYGKHTLGIGKARLDVSVSTRPLTFHWWDGEVYEPRFATVVMGNPAKEGDYWRARGVVPVEWAAGECNAAGLKTEEIENQDGWKTPRDWFNGWYGENEPCREFSGGIAIDEACLLMADQPLTTEGIAAGMALTREAAGNDFHIGLYVACIEAPVDAWLFRQADSTSLIENYWSDFEETVANWQVTASRWGLNGQSLLTIAPAFDENAPTTESQVRRNVAHQRLAAPAMAGLALFNAADLGDEPSKIRKAYAAADQAIEDYFLKPVIFIRPYQGGLRAENIGNEDARGVSICFMDAEQKAIKEVKLPDLKPNQQHWLNPPTSAKALKLKLPSDMHNLYPDSIYKFPRMLDPLQIATSSIKNNAALRSQDGSMKIRLTLNKNTSMQKLNISLGLLAGRKSGVHKASKVQIVDKGLAIEASFEHLPNDSYMFCLKGGVNEELVDADGFALDGDQDGFIEPYDWFTIFFTLNPSLSAQI